MNNVVVISAAQNDTEFQQEILPLLPGTVHRLHYTKGMGGGALENVLSGDKENVIVVLSSGRNDDRRHSGLYQLDPE